MKLLGIGSRIDHRELGKGVVTNVAHSKYWVTFIEGGLETIEIDSEFEVIEAVTDEVDTVSFSDVELSLISILRRWSDTNNATALASKWKGGSLVLKPGAGDLSDKEIPIDTFFHKIVMVRDRIRVMEQKINASNNLDDQEKVDLQQYITRIYGSLTTFNVLFQNKSDQFIGERSKSS
ncbi:hypothetical protein [Maribacter arenosus]|uniref:Uncharacterized protein n=1 Tax=Maribacter arenosus TaxID=1854708 RepID=A0ABR7V7H3_9FLAO|nr:hypothetical protein [Maribacter arenosus]MBD0849620.1 hypothetical protein [Maribacter arenosus]